MIKNRNLDDDGANSTLSRDESAEIRSPRHPRARFLRV